MAPTTRRQRAAAASKSAQAPENDNTVISDNEQEVKETYILDGKEYDSYVAMVQAKRQRNEQVLIQSGLLAARDNLREASKPKPCARGLAAKKRKSEVSLPRRKSSRLAGQEADGRHVESERSGKFTIGGTTRQDEPKDKEDVSESFFKNRINDGSDLSVQQVVELCGPKWVEEDSVALAGDFVRDTLGSLTGTTAKSETNQKSPTSVTSLLPLDKLRRSLDSVSVNDESCVAKVTPNRIYSVACHPSPDTLIVGAGDKDGHVGLWNVNQETGSAVHLFRVHSRPVSNLEWTPSGHALMSSSYDGTVRWFDVASETFQQVFATYNDSVTYRKELGRGLDEGYKYWVQYCTMDHRNSSEQCLFLSTSLGTAMHVDLRVGKNRLSFHEKLSEKKINTVSLHPNGHTLASAGLDCTVKLWDIRKLRNNKGGSNKKHPKPFAAQRCTKSINSAFFSPSGSSLLSTTMANTLELASDAHLQANTVQSVQKIPHDNHTGRWLSTFMAKWHPYNDVFVVGSMRRPRSIEVFDSQGSLLASVQGDALTAVASRCCFHPSQDKMVLVGGNSSGRVTVAR